MIVATHSAMSFQKMVNMYTEGHSPIDLAKL